MKPQPDHPEIYLFDQSQFAPIFTGESFIHGMYLAIACSATLAVGPNLAWHNWSATSLVVKVIPTTGLVDPKYPPTHPL